MVSAHSSAVGWKIWLLVYRLIVKNPGLGPIYNKYDITDFSFCSSKNCLNKFILSELYFHLLSEQFCIVNM